MNIQDLTHDNFVDMFETDKPIDNNFQPKTAKFRNEEMDINLFQPEKQEIKEEDQKQENEEVEPEIFKEKEETIEENKITSIEEYFQDRLNSGLFVPIEDENSQKFIPKTAEEFDEIFKLQIDHKLAEKEKELEEGWYGTKSRAWQAVAKFAEITDDPSEIIPYITGVKNITNISNLDPEDLSSAEKIVRTRLEQRGESEDIIEEQIEALKTTDKLVATAQKYKPLIVQEEQRNLQQLEHQKQQQNIEYINMITAIRENAVKSIETPIFGKKLRREEQAAIYDLIAEPDPESRGYAIYSAIDKLFESGDFEKLKKVALLLVSEDSLINYASQASTQKMAGELQKKLRVAAQFKGSGDESSPEAQTIVRKKYEGKFGR